MQINNEIPLRTFLNGPNPERLRTPNADEDVEHQELSFIAGGNAKCCNHFRRQFGSFS